MLSFMLVVATTFAVKAQSPRIIVDSILLTIDNLNDTLLINAYNNLATNYMFLPNLQDSAQYYASKALNASERINYGEGIQKAHYYLGSVAWKRDEDYTQALFHFNEVKNSILKIENYEKLPSIENAIGAIYLLTGEYESALNQFQLSTDAASESNDYSTMAISTINMAIIYNKLNDKEKAIETNKRALEYIKKDTSQDQSLNQIITSLNLADVYRRNGQLDDAELTLNNIKPVIDSIDYFVANARYNIARAHLLHDQNREEELFQLVSKEAPQLKQNRGYDQLTYSTMIYYYGSGLIKRGRKSEVKPIVNELEAMVENSGIDHKNNLYQYIYDLTSNLGDYEKAFYFLDLHKVLNDSLLNESTNEKIINLEKLYELEKKEKEIESRSRENETLKKRNSTLLALIFGLLFIGSLIYLALYRKRQNEKEQMNQIEQKMLSLQMNPHFIFNAISSIQNYLFDEGDTKIAIHHLSTFASLMRQMLENSREKLIPLQNELDFLTNYMNLQKLRFDDRFNYSINIDKNIDPENISIPPLLMQPFVENAIEHGKIYLQKDGLLHINIRNYKNNIQIEISDNGIGFEASKNFEPKSMVIKKKSLAIDITNERLHLLSKLMKKQFSFNINANKKEAGTTVLIDLPLIYTS
jgi:hypothetical protein